MTLTCGLGLLTFREEAEMTALWVPRYTTSGSITLKCIMIMIYYRGAKFREDFEWVQENFPKQLR